MAFQGYLRLFCREHGEPIRNQGETSHKGQTYYYIADCFFGCKFTLQCRPKKTILKLVN